MKITALFLLAASSLLAADPALTIYNGGFAVVRETLPLELRAGVNQVSFKGVTAQVEPDSVILRDVAGKADFQILEQSYRNDPVSQAMLLGQFEGRTIDFLRREPNKPDVLVAGKVIRSGYVRGAAFTQPIIEVAGKLQFSLPGDPLFPSLGEDNILRPSLNWNLRSTEDAKLKAEVAYLSQGFSWQASYNLVATDKSDTVDLVGWITMNNGSGTEFKDAKVKLMAGDVNRVGSFGAGNGGGRQLAMARMVADEVVSEKSFDEFHLYTLGNSVTLRDRETKQVEFVRATGVKAERIYVFESANVGGRGRPGSGDKVQVYREFKNTKDNGLGLALPKGKLRFYNQDGDRQLEFVGENSIDHTPRDERIRILTGNSFDLVGERKQTNTRQDGANNTRTDSFEIKVRNRKKEPVEIRVVEHGNFGAQWILTAQSQPAEKTDAHTFEFRVPLQPGEEKTITYTIRYNW